VREPLTTAQRPEENSPGLHFFCLPEMHFENDVEELKVGNSKKQEN
jgi:hypothetical protein